MLRKFSLFALVALCASSVSAETIVSDNLGNLIGLPIAGGNATGQITNTNSRVSTSPYKLNVYINNGAQGSGGLPNTDETFWVLPPSNPPLYGNATLVRTGYSSTFDEASLVWNTTGGQYLGSPTAPNENIGLYQYYFTIPVLSSVLVNLTYINAGAPQPVVDQISIFVTNPSVAVGDPQFVGLRGQSFQVHGIDGAVYNIITEKNTQVNARFVFLSEGECPMVNGRLDSNCWSHPGSYMGEMSFQQVVDGKLHQALLVAGPAATGYDLIELDGKKLSVGDNISFGSFRINVRSTHVVSIETESFSFQLSNSDKFINQAVSNLKPLSKLTSHGLLGQTHVAKVYSGATRYIQGEVDDYVIADNSIMGSDFSYNKFQPL